MTGTVRSDPKELVLVDISNQSESKWQTSLKRELQIRDSLMDLSEADWKTLLKKRTITSTNHDTVVSLDWPHYCYGATLGCGGPQGWCYTFQGRLSSSKHKEKVGLVDALAKTHPRLFGEKIASEVMTLVKRRKLPYPNLRYSGSGEVAEHHIPGLKAIAERGIHLWGFTKIITIAKSLREIGASVLISCDCTSDPKLIENALLQGFALAYTSLGVEDYPPAGTSVTFPLHTTRRVREVVSASNLCPKVAEEYIRGTRRQATCQDRCHRCHQFAGDYRD